MEFLCFIVNLHHVFCHVQLYPFFFFDIIAYISQNFVEKFIYFRWQQFLLPTQMSMDALIQKHLLVRDESLIKLIFQWLVFFSKILEKTLGSVCWEG